MIADKGKEIHKTENSVQKKRHYRNNKDSSRSESPERARDRPDRNNRRSNSRHRRNSRNRSPRNRSPRNRSRSPRRDNRNDRFVSNMMIINLNCKMIHFSFSECKN